jgi:tRNA G18 (ribose-2'-O)-methylase SpoU
VEPVELNDISDARLEPYRDLSSGNAKTGSDRFIVEGKHLVHRLLASDFAIESIVVSQRMVNGFREGIPADVPLFVARDELIHELVGFEFHRGVLACGLRPQTHVSLPLSSNSSTVVICPNVRDAENIGSIMRTCRALGVDLLVVGKTAADPFSRRAIRVSMGAAFDLPVASVDDFEALIAELRAREFKVYATMLSSDAIELKNVPNAPAKIAIVLGSEADGLEEMWSDLADSKVMIPMANGTDSLNVGVAAGIVIHQLVDARRQ